jgi:hypothetical protein
MKRVIGGKKYDTEHATVVAIHRYTDDNQEKVLGRLYKTRNGAWCSTHEYEDANEELHVDFVEETEGSAHDWLNADDIELLAQTTCRGRPRRNHRTTAMLAIPSRTPNLWRLSADLNRDK